MNKKNMDCKPDNYYGNRNEMIKFINHNATKILDVGCGDGKFGETLKKMFDVEVWGIELFEYAALVAKNKIDNVIVGNIENDDLELPNKYFDCIVFNDVLEHLINPWEVLSKFSAYLANNGTILASIPNVRYFENIKDLILNKNWDYVDCGILDKTHLRFFTVNSIKDLFESSGYRLIRIEGIREKKFPLKFDLLNKFVLNSFDDMRYLQFACVAQVSETTDSSNLPG